MKAQLGQTVHYYLQLIEFKQASHISYSYKIACIISENQHRLLNPLVFLSGQPYKSY